MTWNFRWISILVVLDFRFALLSFCGGTVDALPNYRYSQLLHGTLNDDEHRSEDLLVFSKDDVHELFIEQHLDHFRLNDPRSFKQRYFYSDRYVRRSGSNIQKDLHVSKASSYAFLCVGGEGPSLDESVLTNSVHCTGDMLELAHRLFYERSDTSIFLYALEHRYYGESYPIFFDKTNSSLRASPVTNEHLVYLSSRQALADLAHFVSSQKTTLPPETKWVTFGGSYPGMMAAWARLRFPHLISAAVSSSAPLQATLDFSAYNNHVARVLKMPKIGGSAKCLDIVAKGHEQLSYILAQPNKADQKTEIAEDFFLCNATTVFQDPANTAMFLGDGVIGVGTQGNDPSCTKKLCSIDKKCKALIDAVDDLNLTAAESLKHFVQQHRIQKNETECINMSWKSAIEFISDPILGQEEGTRSWLWQTCTEFGFYQTCEKQSACPFGRGWHTLKQDLELCRKAFMVHPSQTAKAIQDTLDYYGGWNLASSRILSVNGDVDPWSELAIQQSIGPDLPAYVVKGASHHFWTHPSKLTDSAEVVTARHFIHSTVTKWLDDTE